MVACGWRQQSGLGNSHPTHGPLRRLHNLHSLAAAAAAVASQLNNDHHQDKLVSAARQMQWQERNQGQANANLIMACCCPQTVLGFPTKSTLISAAANPGSSSSSGSITRTSGRA